MEMTDLRSHLRGSSQFFYWLVTNNGSPELASAIADDLEGWFSSPPLKSSDKDEWLAWDQTRQGVESIADVIEDAFAQFEAWKKEQWQARQAASQPVQDDLV